MWGKQFFILKKLVLQSYHYALKPEVYFMLDFFCLYTSEIFTVS
jgi:hypothetical protein